MNRDSIDERSRRAAETARTWGSQQAESRADSDLESVRQAAGLPAVGSGPNRRTLLVVAAASVVVLSVAAVAAYVERESGGDVLVPADSRAVDSTTPEPSVTDAPGTADVAPSTTQEVATTVAGPVGDDAEGEAAPSSREFAVDLAGLSVQDSFAVAEAAMGTGSGAIELGGDGARAPLAPAMTDGMKFVVADRANDRVQVIDWYGVELSQQQFDGEEFGSASANSGDGAIDGLFPSLSLPIATDADVESSDLEIGQPLVAPSGQEIFVPVRSLLDGRVGLQRFVPGTEFPWEFAETIDIVIDGFEIEDELILEQRSIVHTRTGVSVHEFGPEAPFVPIVRQRPGGWTVTDERGVDTDWTVAFPGDASGLVDGSVVIAGSWPDDSAGELPETVLLRLWPDGTAAMSRFVASDGGGVVRVTELGGSTISTTADGGWLLQHWPLPARAMDPPTQPDEQLGACGTNTLGSATEVANGYVLPWTVSGGRAGDNGAYVAVYDALGRTVIGGGCSSASNPPDPLSISGASYTTYGDSVIVAVAEPLSTGGVDDPAAWLGEPIAEGVIESLVSEVKVFRVPDDRELPQADADNTFLLVQVRGARLVRISSGGIGISLPPDGVPEPEPDPYDLQATATEFTQGYLDALAEERWEDAVAYIENDGRSWVDRPAFADLFALVGEDVGTAAALERWCTEERDCTRGVANGVLTQESDTRVTMAITFEVPGGPLFERTINPQWVVGWFEGGLYIDGLPQVPR